MRDVIDAAPVPRIPVRGGGTFPVRRIYCVGRNFADHAREMGAAAPASKADRGTPMFFMKPADAIVTNGDVAYPPSTQDLHHEVELVVALGRDAPPGVLAIDEAGMLVFGYGVGIDLTRRDLQAAAKAKGAPWDIAKGFDQSAICGPIHRVEDVGHVLKGALRTHVNGELRQEADLEDMIWSVPKQLALLSTAFALAPGDLIYTGTPAGVGALNPGDVCVVTIAGLGTVTTTIAAPL